MFIKDCRLRPYATRTSQGEQKAKTARRNEMTYKPPKENLLLRLTGKKLPSVGEIDVKKTVRCLCY
jgi:hypothetical protein